MSVLGFDFKLNLPHRIQIWAAVSNADLVCVTFSFLEICHIFAALIGCRIVEGGGLALTQAFFLPQRSVRKRRKKYSISEIDVGDREKKLCVCGGEGLSLRNCGSLSLPVLDHQSHQRLF